MRVGSSTIFHQTLIAVLFLSIVGCQGARRYPDYGLPSFEVRIEPERLSELLASASAKVEYPAKVITSDDREYRILIEPAGASSILNAKKSWDLKFQNSGGLDGYKEIRLASAHQDASMLRPLLALEVFRAAGLGTSAAEPVVLYLNDSFQGLYIRIEPINEDFFARRGITLHRISRTTTPRTRSLRALRRFWPWRARSAWPTTMPSSQRSFEFSTAKAS